MGDLSPDVKTELELSKREAFSKFFEETHLQVYRYLYGLIGGPPEDVEDLTAETFSKAWAASEQFDGDRQAATRWIFTIAKRKAIDEYRKRAVNPGQTSIETVPLTSPHTSPEERTVANDQAEILWKLLQGLPDEPREMLALRYLLDWKVGEIAEYLGKKDTAVSMAIRRTLGKLRDAWPESQ